MGTETKKCTIVTYEAQEWEENDYWLIKSRHVTKELEGVKNLLLCVMSMVEIEYVESMSDENRQAFLKWRSRNNDTVERNEEPKECPICKCTNNWKNRTCISCWYIFSN